MTRINEAFGVWGVEYAPHTVESGPQMGDAFGRIYCLNVR